MEAATVCRSERRMWAPLVVSVAWLLGTFGLFWLGGRSAEVPDPGLLCTFVLSATAAFALGYTMRIWQFPRTIELPKSTSDNSRRASQLVVVSGWYYGALGLALLLEYGATGPGSILESIRDPGTAYLSKFEVYRTQQETGRVSLPIQILTMLAVLSTLMPFLIVYWRRLRFGVRMLALCGLGVYTMYFLYIGTLKGLGDVVIMSGASAMVALLGTWQRPTISRPNRRKTVLLLSLLGTAFVVYMSSSQASRIALFGTQELFPPNPLVADIVGEDFATGLAANVYYPTHGYLGLAYNLGSPFVWTEGFGSSPAITSYAQQYLGVGAIAQDSYPARTESLTGWPAGLYWATIYPWLASDLTFPGTVVFMGIAGWIFARLWVEGAIFRDHVAMLLFIQLCLAIAYIPANNQLGASRPSVIAVTTLVGIYAFRSLAGQRSAWAASISRPRGGGNP